MIEAKGDTTLIVNISQAGTKSIYGGKASALSVLIANKFSVPNAFVIPVDNLLDNPSEFEALILRNFDSLETEYASVRSSAVNEDGHNSAWAGQLATFLNCCREDVISYVYRCQDSVKSDRALSYAKNNNSKVGKVAVIVQEMIQSEVSGVSFSINPVTKDSSQIITEAGYGLGEAIVSGDITPDSYVYSKKTKQIITKAISRQTKCLMLSEDGKNIWAAPVDDFDRQKLTDRQIADVAEQVLKLEELFGYPVDVEWGIVGGAIYILQCRPVTGL